MAGRTLPSQSHILILPHRPRTLRRIPKDSITIAPAIALCSLECFVHIILNKPMSLQFKARIRTRSRHVVEFSPNWSSFR
jgi:hypothetical protein